MVFEAVHVTAGGQAAIKILRPEVAGHHDITARFFNEARAANSISHPSIVRVFDCGYASNGLAYLAMEFLAGETLRERLERSLRLTTGESLRTARQIASALHAAHQRKVVHRDMKPDNVMLVPDPDVHSGERVKILDFGISKIADSLGAEPVRTRSDLLMGTPTYMAPEQCRGAKHVTDKSDVYSLGIILYQMLAGRPPFVGESVGELIAMHLTDEPPPLTQVAPHVGPQVSSLVHAMLEKKVIARPNMEAVLRELLRFVNALASFPTIRPSGEISVPPSDGSFPGPEQLVPVSDERSFSLPVNQPSTQSDDYQKGPEALPVAPAALENLRNIRPSPSEPPTQPLSIIQIAALLPNQTPTEKRPAIAPRQQTEGVPGFRRASSDGKTLTGTASEVRGRTRGSQRIWNGLIGFVGLGLIAITITWYMHKHQKQTSHTASGINPITLNRAEQLTQNPLPNTARAAEAKARERNTSTPVLIEKPDTQPQLPLASTVTTPSKEDIAAEQNRSKAYTALKEHHYQEAQQWASNCINIKPKNSKCWWILGKSACRSNEFSVISKSVEKLEALGKIDLVDEVIDECYSAGLRTDSNGIFYHPDLRNPFTPRSMKSAFELAAKGNCDDAIRMAKTYVETQPEDAWYIIGKCACSTKKIGTANLAISKLSKSPSTLVSLINFCVPMGFDYSQGQLRIK